MVKEQLDMPTVLKDSTSRHKLKFKIRCASHVPYHRNRPSCIHPDLTTSGNINSIIILLPVLFSSPVYAWHPDSFKN